MSNSNLQPKQFYHVGWSDDRESIQKHGLKTGQGEGGRPGRVWLYSDLDIARQDPAGSDIWSVQDPPNVRPGKEFSSESQHKFGNTWASDNVPPSNIQLIESRD